MCNIKIIVISDSIGDTGELVAKASLAQFKFDNANNNIKKFPHIDSTKKIDEVIMLAQSIDAMLVYTLVVPDLRDYLKEQLKNTTIESFDVLGPLINYIAKQTHQEPLNEAGRVHLLDADYFKRIEAMEFAVKYDDGKDPSGLDQADIVLIGVSRTSKTPLSQFLAHKRYKVMNVPMVPEIKPHESLLSVNPKKCVGLKIDIKKLTKIRRERLIQLGLKDTAIYANDDRIQAELKYFDEVMEQIGCPVIDVTDKAIEETANHIIKYIESNKSKD